MHRLTVWVQSMIAAEIQIYIRFLEPSCLILWSPCTQHTVFHCKGLLMTFWISNPSAPLLKALFFLTIIIFPHVCFYCGKEMAGWYIRILLFLEAKVLRKETTFYSDRKENRYIPKKVIQYLHLAFLTFSFFTWCCR